MGDAVRFLDLLRELTKNEVEFVVVGGVAAILAGAPISTFDLDIVYHQTPENGSRLMAAIASLDATYRDPAGRRIMPDTEKLATHQTHLLMTSLGALDLLSQIGDELDYPRLLTRSIEYELSGLRLAVLDLPTIIETKEHAARDKDRAVLPILYRTLQLRDSS